MAGRGETNGVDQELLQEEEEAQARRLEWNGEAVDFAGSMLVRARAYGSYVNTDRALPDVRDGLKPVQRRIIVTMDELGARADKKRQKSAQITGAVIGRYHPHGNSAVYDAMVRMAQDFVMNVPLISGQGGWGTVDGDPAAAERYTEARLSSIASDALGDVNRGIVAYRENYDQTREEPTVLPVTFPNLLVNGAKGIGWSMACEIPPHNLGEVIDAVIYLADHPDATIKQLMKRLPAPDFPTGGIIVNPDALEECYATGRGTIVQQCKYTIENVPGNQQAIIITELPYLVAPSKIVTQVRDAARAEKITDVTENATNLSDKNGVKVQVTCKRGGNVQKLLGDLLQYTDCRKTIAFNMNVLIDRTPRVVNLKEMLQHFLDFRHEIVTKRLELEREDKLRKLKRLQALIAALDVIDQVVKIIRSSKNDEDSRAKLIKLLKYTPHGTRKAVPIDEEQAQQILDMPLKRLNQLNRMELQAEAKALGARIDEITAILKSATGVVDIVKEELRETKKAYAQPRKTYFGGDVVVASSGKGKDPGVVSGPVEPVTCYITNDGRALVAPRGNKRPSTAPIKGNEPLVSVFDTQSNVALYGFSEQGVCYRVSIADQAPETSKGKGRQLFSLNRGDRLVAVHPVASAPFYTLVTQEGELKRIAEDVIANSHPGGVPAMGVESSDRVVAVVAHEEQDELLLSTAYGKALRTELAKLRAVKGGAAGGVAGPGLADGDHIVSAVLAKGDYLLVVHETGQAKRVPLKEYPTKGRTSGGVASAATDKPTRGPGPAGLVVAGLCVDSKAEPVLYTRSGQLLAFDPKQIAEGTRAAVSKPTFDLGPGDAVAGVISTTETAN